MISKVEVFRDSWPPRELPCRHDELQQLSRRIAPATHGFEAHDVLIHGPSGVGKTVTADYFLSNELPVGADIAWADIRCGDKTEHMLLKEAVDEHPRDSTVHLNWKTDRIKRTLERVVDEEPYILVLDEADTIADHDILETLDGIDGVSVIVIAHSNIEWLGHLNDSVTGNFDVESVIKFNRYSTAGLLEILEPRVRKGLDGGVISHSQLKRIAKVTDGVARYAIKAVWAAAEIAEERGRDRVQDTDVEDCFDRAQMKMRAANLESLPLPHRAIYELARRLGPVVESGDLERAYLANREAIYADRYRDPVKWRQVRNYLEKLEEYDLIERKGETRDRRYKVLDTNLEAAIDVEFSFDEMPIA